MRRSLIFGTALISGCVATGVSQGIAISYLYEDAVEMQAFRLTYKNETNKTMCLTPDNWPNAAGKLDQASSRAWIEIEGSAERFAVKDFNTGYCPECAQKVGSGETITGIIPYREFSIPEEHHTTKKTLHFRPQAFPCK